MLSRICHLKHFSRCSLCFSRNLCTKVKMDPSISRASNSLPNPSFSRCNIFRWNSNITSCFRKGDINTARRYFEEMPYKNLVTWNCMISGYVRNSKMIEAQKMFDLMPSRNVVSWTALLTGYAKCGKLEYARDLFEKMPDRNAVCWNSMITGYVNSGRIIEARELFDLMPNRNNVSWAVMISGYLQQNLISEAQALFDQVPVMETETTLYNVLLSGYVDLGCLKGALDLFAKMQRRDAVSWNTMITGSSRSGAMDLARRLFEEMPNKDIISWTTIVRGYLLNGEIEEGRILFDKMPDRDIVAWNTMIGGYAQNGMLDDAMRLFQEMPIRDTVSWNSILLGYVEKGDIFNAKLWFEKIPQRNETSWNTLISRSRDEEALVLFSKMTREGFMPDQGTFTVVISVCGSLVALQWGRMIHLHAIRAGYENDTMVMSSLITMYSKCGLISDSSIVFGLISKMDTIAWNAMIAAQAYHGLAGESRMLFHTMIEAGFQPDHVTFLGLLSACAHSGLVDEGMKYFESMQKDWKLIPKPEHYSCVVDIIGRSGSVVDAYEFIEKIIPLELQSNTWGTLLGACRVQENLELGELAAANSVLYSQPLSGGMYVLLSNIYAAKGRFEDAARIRTLMKERGAKKELACSWIEIKGNMCPFVYNNKSHPQMEEICMELDNLSMIMERSN